LESARASKVDYRIVEVVNASPSTEIKSIVILDRPPSQEMIDEFSSSEGVKVERVLSSIMVIKVRGKAKSVVELASKDYVRHVILEEILPSEA